MSNVDVPHLMPCCCSTSPNLLSYLGLQTRVALQIWVRAAQVCSVQLKGQPYLLTHSTMATFCSSAVPLSADLVETLMNKGVLDKEFIVRFPGCRPRPVHTSKQHLCSLMVHPRVGLT